MLSRTANNIFWLARYMERADYVARLISVALRMAGMEGRKVTKTEWQSTIVAAGVDQAYFAKHEKIQADAVIDFLVRDPDNPSSILSCFTTARNNARAIRSAITIDMWQAINDTWLEAQDLESSDFNRQQVDRVLEWAKNRAQLFSGAYLNTMLRKDSFYFTCLATQLERADNTARILDVKYHVLLPKHETIGGLIDYYQWTAILRAVSALRAYHWIYADRIRPWNVAELLILRPEMPRSLMSCYSSIVENLNLLAGDYGGRRGECHRLAGELHARLRYGRIYDIFQTGLHEFLTEYVDKGIQLGDEIAKFYLM
jgi:uncharacterized alpha-E superfamily protein